MSEIRAAYLAAADSAAALLGDAAVARCWAAPSALPEFGVRGLAGHLAAQVLRVRPLLADPVPQEPPIPLLEHYARGRWLGAGLDDEANVGIRRAGEEAAGPEAAVLSRRVARAADELRAALPAEPADRVVHLPWGPWSLRLDDFLLTRMMEIAVHSDDLAVSVGVSTPVLPSAVLEPVLDLLARLAVRRHGATALLRALSRAERAPASVSAL
ncbi:maleylpyruvate isomerase N-terminal domain-containing protein [Plantactinospora sp. CA-290183]|uniref:maleylpyruvate isomerase N-terminal domain-containing protein n=1 Tax=Plantactinospora sp. CA-290183 TaxID=3240006 RepID=UPI003D933AB1